MTTLHDLAARVEGLSGPDRGIDAEIELAIGNWPAEHYEAWCRYQECGECVNPPILQPINPRWFTTSIDAAMTLVPEGWLLAGMFQRNCKLPNWIWKAELWSPDADRNVSGIARNADCPAIALTACALKARATQPAETDHGGE